MRSGVVVASKYRIVRELGSGGMGSVWQAVHLVTEREFAIKFLHASCASSPDLLQRFFQEARVSGKLRHPSIIEIFDVGTAAELGGAPYLVMELLDGASLDVVVRKVGPMPARLVLETAAEVARALALAHAKGIVHRDLKPANIFLHRPGTGALVPKVLDFGISKIASTGAGAGAFEASAGLTQTGAVLGSPLYMSPEQAASDKSIDGRSDVHALGVVLWECLVGDPPFLADTYNNLVVQIITGERPRVGQALPSAAPGVAAIVERAMARRREDRFQSAAELADALDAEIATMGPGPSLTSRTSASELFARLGQRSIRPEVANKTTVSSTTGGMSVPSSPGRSDPSPVAMTVGESSHSPIAFEETHRAVDAAPAVSSPVAPTLAATVDQPLFHPPPQAPATTGHSTTRRSRSRAMLAAGGALVVVAGAIAIPLALRRPAVGDAARMDSPAVAVSPPEPAATAAALANAGAAPTTPSAASNPPATSATIALPAPGAATSARPAAVTTSASPAGVASSARAPLPTAGRATTPKHPTKRPDDSLDSSGFH